MHLVWKIFEYIKYVKSDKDKYSYCKTLLHPHSCRLFLESSSEDKTEYSSIPIFSTPSKTIEMLLINNYLEIRLFEWEQKGTNVVILEKLELPLKIKRDNKRSLIINDSFVLNFYTETDLKDFLRKSNDLNIENINNNFINEINRLNLVGDELNDFTIEEIINKLSS